MWKCAEYLLGASRCEELGTRDLHLWRMPARVAERLRSLIGFGRADDPSTPSAADVLSNVHRARVWPPNAFRRLIVIAASAWPVNSPRFLGCSAPAGSGPSIRCSTSAFLRALNRLQAIRNAFSLRHQRCCSFVLASGGEEIGQNSPHRPRAWHRGRLALYRRSSCGPTVGHHRADRIASPPPGVPRVRWGTNDWISRVGRSPEGIR